MTVPNNAAVPAGPGVPAASPAQPVSTVPAGQTATPASAPAAPAQVTPGQGVKPDSMVPLSALHEERNKRQALAAELDQLRTTVESLKTQPSQQQPVQQQQQAGVTNEQIEKMWEDDPKQAVRTEIMMAFNWYDQMSSQMEQVADQIAGQNPDFNLIRGQVMNYVRALPLERRNAQAVQQAYFTIRGQNVDTILKQREAEMLARMQIPAGFQMPTGAVSPSPSIPAGMINLTQDQINVAEAMGLTPEQYASQMKRQ